MDDSHTRNIDPWIPPALADGRLGTLEVVGRLTGRTYGTPVGFAQDADGSLIVGSAHPASQWQRNLVAAGRCQYTILGQTGAYAVRELTGDEREAAIALLVTRYAQNPPRHPVFRLTPIPSTGAQP